METSEHLRQSPLSVETSNGTASGCSVVNGGSEEDVASIRMVVFPTAAQASSQTEDPLLEDSGLAGRIPSDYEFSSKSPEPSRALNTLYKSLRLSLVKSLIASRWRTPVLEGRKVAIHRSRLHAGIRCAIHVIPVSAALALISLNLWQYYVGGELAGEEGHDSEKLGALQFAAKLHEMFMIASLGTIVFTYIRRELVFGEGIPYGALSAGLEIDKFSFLYSPELWSAIWADWERKRKKWILLALLISCAFLAVSAGPSTANLMRPRLDDWPAGGTTYWINATHAEISPVVVDQLPSSSDCSRDNGDPACPHGDWRLLEREYWSYWPRLLSMGSMPESLGISSSLSGRTMTVRHRSTNDYTKSIWQSQFTSATIQHSAIADGLSEVGRLWAFAAANNRGSQRFVYRRDATYTTLAPQPVTQARCVENVVGGGHLVAFKLEFPVLAQPTCDRNLRCIIGSPSLVQLHNVSLQLAISQELATTLTPILTWVDTSDVLGPSNNSIHAVAIVPNAANGSSLLYCCTVDSRIAVTRISATRNLPKVVTGYPKEFTDVGTNNASWPRIAISAPWAALLNPSIEKANQTVFSQATVTAGMWNTTTPSQAYNYPFIVESILALMVTNGLGRTTYNSTLVGTLKGSIANDPWQGGSWVEEMLPKYSLGWGGSVYDIDANTAVTATMLNMRATVTGYAWSSDGLVQQAAIAVLLLYSIFAIAHYAYSLKTGWTSTSWDTTPEIIALAMNSERPEPLHHTGAGIDTVYPLKQKIKIRCADYRLQYVFQDGQDKGTQVVPNKHYS